MPFLGQICYPDALECRGALGQVYIFKQYGWWRRICPYYYPFNPRTIDQQAWRVVFSNAVAQWQGFDNNTKDYYNKIKSKRVMSGYNRFLSYYLSANMPVVNYWGAMEKSATDPVKIPDYIASANFARGLYPAAADKPLALGPSGDLVLPAGFSANIKNKCRVYLNANQNDLVSAQWTKVLLDSENYDPNNNFDISTNHRYTVPISGYYLITSSVCFTSVVAAKRYGMAIYKNGAYLSENDGHASVADTFSLEITDIVYLEKDDYIELYALSIAGVNTVDILGYSGLTYLSIHLLST